MNINHRFVTQVATEAYVETCDVGRLDEEVFQAAKKARTEVFDQIEPKALSSRITLIPRAGLSSESSFMITRKLSSEGRSSFLREDKERVEQDFMKELAERAFKYPWTISQYMKSSGTVDQNTRVEVAKIAAAQSGRGVSFHIQNYGIMDQKALVAIAKIAVVQDAWGASEYIKNYGIQDEKDLVEIAKAALYKSPFEALPHLSFFINVWGKQYRNLALYGLLCGFVFDDEIRMGLLRDFSEVGSFLGRNHRFFIQEIEDSSLKKKTVRLFSLFLQMHAKELLKEALWSESERDAIIGKIDSYRNQSIAASLALELLEESSHVDFKDSYLFFILEKGRKELIQHKILPSILIAKWLAQVKREEILTSQIEKNMADLNSFLRTSRGEFRNNYSSLTQTFLLTTRDLDKETGISFKRKLELIACICNEGAHLKGLGLIRALLARKELDGLNSIRLERPIQELKEVFEELLVKDSYLNLSEIENLADKYLVFFENTRIPLALETYAGPLRTLSDERVRLTLERFVRSILEGTFEEERYKIDKNPHLQKIQEYDEQNGTRVLDGWKSLTFEMPIASIFAVSAEEDFSFESFFMKKLGDRHGYQNGVDRLPFLSEFLKATPDSREGIWLDLLSRIEAEKASISFEITSEERARVGMLLKLDQVQKSCIDLIKDSSLSKESQAAKLESIASAIPNLELSNDLKGLSSILKGPKASSSLEKIVFCSGWEDLFLSGTEVSGSCQRIDGDPNLNKCLLAYCLDGKNSMLVVKGRDGKIIARSMLRLLWNNTDSKPVLFLDRLYSNRHSKEIEDAIQRASIECSKQLSLDLFTVQTGIPLSTKNIGSLGSSCPFEYADGGDGVMTDGVYTLKKIGRLI